MPKFYFHSLLATIGFLLCSNVFGQKIFEKVHQNLLVEDKVVLSPFEALPINESEKSIGKLQLFRLDINDLNLFYQHQNASVLEITIPGDIEMQLELIPSNPIAEGALVKTATGESFPIQGAFFHGIVKDNPNSLVALSVVNNELSAIIQLENEVYALGKSTEKSKDIYALRSDNSIPDVATYCATNTEKASTELKGLPEQKSLDNCVNVYFELDYDVFQEKGSVDAATSFIASVFNEVNALYVNESINIKISEVFVWNFPSPYLGLSSSFSLNQFQILRPVFNGDLAQLVDFRTSNGGIAYVDVLCGALPYSYSGARPNFDVYPTYSWTVEVIAHELGHNLGSPHTHDCSWPNGALDNCVAPSGSCDAGPEPNNGGTVMSYCHLTDYGINFNNGFGKQPGDLIRDRVANASCLETCDIVCGVPTDLEVNLIEKHKLAFAWNNIGTAVSYVCLFQEKGSNDWIEIETTTNQVSIDNLNESTQYVFKVASVCRNGASVYSSEQTVLTYDAPTGYCPSSGMNSSNEWIESVTIGNKTVTTKNDDGYGFHLGTTFYMSKKKLAFFDLEPGFTDGIFSQNTFPEYWRIWIDFNKDGDFEDENEMVFDAGTTSRTNVRGQIFIPSEVENNIGTRMRVSMKYNAAPTACEEFAEGEVEDYSVYISDEVTSIQEQIALDKLQVYPNPNRGAFTVTLSNGIISSYQLIDRVGRVVLTEKTFSNTVNVNSSKLASGSYIFVCTSENGFRFSKKVVVVK